MSAVNILLNSLNLGDDSRGTKILRITVPENLDYEGKFDSVLKKHLKSYTYDEIRTTNMGSLYKITLSVVMKENASSRELLDELRAGNGNLDISLGRMLDNADSL